MVASVSSLAHKCNNFRRQFVGSLIHEHSQTTLTSSKTLHFPAVLRDSEELLYLWLQLCPASPTNVIFFSGNSSAVFEPVMSTVRLQCKKLHFRAVLRDSGELFHLWLRLCPASPSNEIIFVGISSAVCESFMSTVRVL